MKNLASSCQAEILARSLASYTVMRALARASPLVLAASSRFRRSTRSSRFWSAAALVDAISASDILGCGVCRTSARFTTLGAQCGHIILALGRHICSPAFDFEKRLDGPARHAVQGVDPVPGLLSSSQIESSSWPRYATLPSPTERHPGAEREAAHLAILDHLNRPGSSTLAATRKDPSRPSSSPAPCPRDRRGRARTGAAFRTGWCTSISAPVRSARLARWPRRGAGGCHAADRKRFGCHVVLFINTTLTLNLDFLAVVRVPPPGRRHFTSQ